MTPYAERPGAEQDQAMVAELREVGIDVDSVYELRERYPRYPEAIPILVDWLPRVTAFGLKESMLRSLAVRYARSTALPALLREFVEMDTSEDPTGYELRWAAGNAIETLWDDAHFEELAGLCADALYGRGREMLVRGLGRSQRPEAADLAVRLLDDPDVRVPAIAALRKLAPPPEYGVRERLLTLRESLRGTPDTWIVKDIDKTLAKLSS